MGLLMQKEVDVLLGLRNNPKPPFVAVLGGAKISDKLGVVEALLEIVDELVIGGGWRIRLQGARRFIFQRTWSVSTLPATSRRSASIFPTAPKDSTSGPAPLQRSAT